MSDPPKIIDPPSPPPRPFVTVVLIAIALILLLLGQTTAGIVFVALALVSSLYDLFGRRAGGNGSRAQGPQGPTAGTR